MITLAEKLDREIFVAFSGGVDSVVAVDFLSRNHRVTLVYVNHGDDVSKIEEPFVSDFANTRNLDLMIFRPDIDQTGLSKEFAWSKARDRIFRSLDKQVVTGHHLDDAVETWIMSCSQGNPRLMLPSYGDTNVVKPFLLNRKEKLIDYARRRNLSWISDPTNRDSSYSMRNYVRNTMMPHFLGLNPGIYKTISNKIRKELFTRQA